MKSTFFKTTLLTLVLALLFAGCSLAYNSQLTSFEKAVDQLDNYYQEYTDEELAAAIEHLDAKLEALNSKQEKLSVEQRGRLRNLTGRYQRVLLKINVSNTLHLQDVEESLQYIRGLITGE